MFEGRPRETCCGGCQAVANAIIENGLGAYYHHRTGPAGGPGEPLSPDDLRELTLYFEAADPNNPDEFLIQTTTHAFRHAHSNYEEECRFMNKNC